MKTAETAREKLCRILGEVTTELPENSRVPEGIEVIDLCIVRIGVDKIKAGQVKEDFMHALYLCTEKLKQLLMANGNYIEVGGELDDQGLALRVFALGKVLGFWNIFTPKDLGADKDQARRLAGLGDIRICRW
jgi:hypothetical protein